MRGKMGGDEGWGPSDNCLLVHDAKANTDDQGDALSGIACIASKRMRIPSFAVKLTRPTARQQRKRVKQTEN